MLRCRHCGEDFYLWEELVRHSKAAGHASVSAVQA